jgi:glycosyltransferase involved in cell wall biosynthesis
MNVLWTITRYWPAVGGAETYSRELVRRLCRAGDVKVATLWDTNRTDWLLGATLRGPDRGRVYTDDGLYSVHRVPFPAAKRRAAIPWVLGYHGLTTTAVDRLSDVFVPELATLAGSADLVHNIRVGREHWSYAAWKIARQHDLPFILTPLHHPRWVGWFYRAYLELYRRADALIALTEAEKRVLISLGVSAERIFVTGMGPVLAEGADAARFQARRGVESPLVLFLGQKYAYKGFEALLRAAPLVWKQLPDARFVFIGPRTDHSRRVFRSVSDPRIVELDTVDLQEKTDALAACDVLCVPSTQESFGGVFLEAWSLGKPVIGADIPAVREVVTDERDGYLVAQQPKAIAERLVTLLGDPHSAARMGALGRQKVEQLYTWDGLARATTNVYEWALRNAS